MFPLRRFIGLITCLVLTTFSLYAQPQSLEEVGRYEGKMANPKDVTVTADGHALLLDPARREAGLTLIDLEQQQEVARVASGYGPGLIRMEGNQVLTQSEDSTLWLWQRSGKQLSIFEKKLQHHASRTLSDAGDGLFPLNDSTAVAAKSLSSGKTLFEYHSINDGYRFAKSSNPDVTANAHPLLGPLGKNPMLRQGHYVVDEGEAFIAFRFSSTILKLDNDGVQQVIPGQNAIPFPKYEVRSDDSNGYQAPDVTEHPIATTDLSLGDRYVYVLHHGETFDIGTLSQFTKAVRGRMEAAVEEWELTNRLLIYDRSSLEFVRELELPHEARAISVDADHLYILTVDDMPPSLITYQKPDIN